MRLASGVVVLLLAVPGSSLAFSGFAGGGLGATMPQGEFNKYTEAGFGLNGYGRFDLPGMRSGGLRLGVQGVFFERDEQDVRLQGYPNTVLTEIYSNEMIKATLGVEFSPRVISLEPYIGGGIGVYNFASKTKLETEDGVEIASNTLSSETYFGWNVSGGMRVYVIPRLAVDANVQYDIVEDMKQYSGKRIVDFNSEFLSIFLGVSVRLGMF